MAPASYRKDGLVFDISQPAASSEQVADLQHDLRQLGYLKRGVDGKFGQATDLAIRRVRHDLLHNDGRSTGGDGNAPVGVRSYNRDRVTEVSGVVDHPLADCIADMLDDAEFPKLPYSANPAQANRDAVERVRALPPTSVPMPFLLGMFAQESGLKHFREPAGGDKDAFIVVGLDTNAGSDVAVTSRGYGMGQYTLFHHPPRADEVTDFMLDPVRNVEHAVKELRGKFEQFIVGPTPGTRADDRIVEVGAGLLRPCKYPVGDARYMRDCVTCLRAAGSVSIVAGETPLYRGSPDTYRPTQYYAENGGSYAAVPDRTKVECDWPYALRRYNGSGINSFHYQARVLTHVLTV